ncbi:MAG: P1 family peptidase [Pseudomonadota bacterium]
MAQRARDLGLVIGGGETGPRNAITDVAGVTVGHVTRSEPDQGIQTGVTVIKPHSGNLYSQPVPAMVHVGNGFGKFIGLSQVCELGELETPIAITNTLNAPQAASGLIEQTLAESSEALSVNPVVGEINDGKVNAIRERVVAPGDTQHAWFNASELCPEGNVGAGTGGEAYGWKGGVGTASRVVDLEGVPYTVGMLTVTNLPGQFAPRGIALVGEPPTASSSGGKGSIIMVIATDAPVCPGNLGRMASRSLLGVARTGTIMPNGSGDYAIAFSTKRRERANDQALLKPSAHVANQAMDPLFEASVEAAEEAVLNAMVAAETVETPIGTLRRYPFEPMG